MAWRSHQSQFAAICDRLLSSGDRRPRQVVCDITPGGGKSFLPVIAAAKLIPAIADRICWLPPRAALVGQAGEAFRDPLGRQLLGHRMHLGTDPGQGQGFAATYQALLTDPRKFIRAFEQHRTILVCDEPHHAAEGGEWASALAPLVERSPLLIQMSGTFQRHDHQAIAFLPYREVNGGGRCFDLEAVERAGALGITYPRSQALAERAVIPLEVRWFDLSASWLEDGVQQNLFSIAAVEDEDLAKDGLHLALKSGAAQEILAAGYRDWLEHRHRNPRSKLLVVAPNIATAHEYKANLEALGAYRVGIAVSSDSTQAHRNIDRFKLHTDNRIDCLVSVGMAYEGLDVPSCTHIVALTKIRSIPWIEQMVTRATRVDRGPGALPYEDQVAYLYCPDDMLMRRCIEAIIEQQQAIAARRIAAADRSLLPPPEPSPTLDPPPRIELLAGTATLSGASDLEGDRLTATEIQQIPKLARVTGTPEHVLRGMRVRDLRSLLHNSATAIQQMQSDPLLQPVVVNRPVAAPSPSLRQLRDRANSLAMRLDAIQNLPPGTTNGRVKAHFQKSRTVMSDDELERVIRWLETQSPRQEAV